MSGAVGLPQSKPVPHLFEKNNVYVVSEDEIDFSDNDDVDRADNCTQTNKVLQKGNLWK